MYNRDAERRCFMFLFSAVWVAVISVVVVTVYLLVGVLRDEYL